jgi:hypothetical protein
MSKRQLRPLHTSSMRLIVHGVIVFDGGIKPAGVLLTGIRTKTHCLFSDGESRGRQEELFIGPLFYVRL